MNECGMEINRTHNVDCLDGLRNMAPGSVDLVVTSPPYNCRKNYGVMTDEMSWPDYYYWMEFVLRGCYRVLVPGGVLALNVPNVVRWQFDHKFRHTWADFDPVYEGRHEGVKYRGRGRIEPVAESLTRIMRDIDKHLREPITWVKGDLEGGEISTCSACGCDSDPRMRACQEVILLGSKQRWFHDFGTGRRGKEAVPFMDYTKDVWYIRPAQSRTHPAVFPEEIPLRLIRLFIHRKGGVVLDPFMGEGATARAARRLGVNFVGFELNQEFCRRANSYQMQIMGAVDDGP